MTLGAVRSDLIEGAPKTLSESLDSFLKPDRSDFPRSGSGFWSFIE